MRFLPAQPATNSDGLTPEERRLKESQLAYAKKKAEREEKERVIREEEEKQRKIKQLEMWKEQKKQAKLAKIEREKDLRAQYKAKLEADLAAELERVRLEKEAEEERKRIAEEKRQKAIRAERVRKIKEEQERLELEVRRVDMKKEGMTNEEINIIFERERIEKETRLREEEERRQEEEKQRLLAEAEKLRNRFAKKKKKGDKARRQTAGGLLESASRTSSAPQSQQKSRLLAAVEKQSKLQNNNNPSPPKSKLLEAVSKQSKKRSKRHTVDTLAAHKKEGKTVVTIDGSGEEVGGNNTEVVEEESGVGGSEDNETKVPSTLDSLAIGEADAGEGSVSTGGSRLLAAVKQQSRNNTIATLEPPIEEKCDKPTPVVSPPPPKPQPHNKLPEKVLLSTDGSSDRVTEVEERLQNELQQLKLDIQRVGDPTQPACSFGELFADEFAEQFYEGIAATLKAAKKRGIVKYNSPLLLKGAHDNVMINLVADKPVADVPEASDTSTQEVSSEEPVQVDPSIEVPPEESDEKETGIEITTTSLEKVEIEGGDTHDNIDKVQDTDSTSGSRPSLEDEEEEELPTYEEWLAANGESFEAGEC